MRAPSPAHTDERNPPQRRPEASANEVRDRPFVLAVGETGLTMLDSELRHRVDVSEAITTEGASGLPGAARTCTIRLRDAFLNYAFSDQLKESLKGTCAARLESGVRDFVVDLTAVNVMDSCGLSVLIGLRKLISEAGGRLVLIATSPILLRLFKITRLDAVFEIAGDETAAAAALRRIASPPSAPQPAPTA